MVVVVVLDVGDERGGEGFCCEPDAAGAVRGHCFEEARGREGGQGRGRRPPRDFPVTFTRCC